MSTTTTTLAKFEEWAVIEIMGHKRFAGFITEQAIGGASFVRVDVPEIDVGGGTVMPAFTKLFGAASVYCISPCTEQTARAFAKTLRAESFHRYEAPRLEAHAPTAPSFDDDDDDDEDYVCSVCGASLPTNASDLCDECSENHPDGF